MYNLLAVSPNQVHLVFFANRVSDKVEEIEKDSHVNVSFYDPSTTNWASYSGVAQVSQDKDKIAQHWSSKCMLPVFSSSCVLTLYTSVSLHFSATSRMESIRETSTILE